jgi:hypothetical protein
MADYAALIRPCALEIYNDLSRPLLSLRSTPDTLRPSGIAWLRHA